MFGFGKKKVTHQDLAEALYDFAVDFTELMANRELTNDRSPYKGIDRQHFMHEWLITMFWVMHRVPCECDKVRFMGLIHTIYFKTCGLMRSKETAVAEQNLIISRFNEYDEAFDPSASVEHLILGGVIAKNILNRDEFVLNAEVSFLIATDVLLLMKETKDIFDKYKVVE